MTLVAVAFAVGLRVQLGLDDGLAAIAAVSVYAGMLATHATVRRSTSVLVLSTEVERLEAEVSRLRQGSQAGTRLEPSAAQSSARGPSLPTAGSQAPRTGQGHPDWSHRPDAAMLAPWVGGDGGADGGANDRGQRVPQPRPEGAEPHAPLRHEMTRPARSSQASAPAPASQSGLSAAEARAPQGVGMPRATSSEREAAVELVQGLVKKLADQVKAAELSGTTSAASDTARGLSAASNPAENAIEASLGALRATAETMRAAQERPEQGIAGGVATKPQAASSVSPEERHTSSSARATPRPAPPPVKPGHAHLSAVADAVLAGRVDVLLEPILGLADQRARHYEVLLRLRNRSGKPFVAGEVADLNGTGLLPLLDGVRIARSAQIARRLSDRGKATSLFSSVSSESLASDDFLNQFADAYRKRVGVASQLVLSFSQNDVRAFTTRDWETLKEMRDLGFRFSMTSVVSLDMDFESLKAAGFEFVRLDADVFLQGMVADSAIVPSDDICRHLASAGLTLILEHIDDEAKLARVLGFGVLFGQGQLFGGPRPVKAQVLERSSGQQAVA